MAPELNALEREFKDVEKEMHDLKLSQMEKGNLK
jgi:hypothetical protein